MIGYLAIRRLVRATVVFSFTLVVSMALTSPAQAYACGSQFGYRGSDYANGITNAVGVRGVIHVPNSGDITGISPSHGPSVADMYLITPTGNDYLQVGWYVGSNPTGLTYTTTPRFFVGEERAGVLDNETLRPGAALAWGSYHTFSIGKATVAGKWDFYLDNVYQLQTIVTHFSSAEAAFNGEINYACVTMRAYAQKSAPSTLNLQYLIGSTWHNFVDLDHVTTTNGVAISSVSTFPATNVSTGGG